MKENYFSNPFAKFCADIMRGCCYILLTLSHRRHLVTFLVRAKIMTVPKYRSVTTGEESSAAEGCSLPLELDKVVVQMSFTMLII